MASKPGRLKWIDYARGIAIILVVYRHAFEGLKESGLDVFSHMYLEYANIFFFSFRMPLFFIVSGVFIVMSLRKRGLGKFVATKGKTILYPYFLWACIQLTIQLFFSAYTNGSPTAQTYLYLFYLPREIAHFWYLYALFNISVLYAFTVDVLKFRWPHNMVLGAILFALSIYTWQNDIVTGFVGDILHYYIFFAIGDAVSGFILDRDKSQLLGATKMILVLLIPFLAGQAYFLLANMDHAEAKYMYVEYYQPVAFLLIALTGCAFVISISFLLQRTNRLNWLSILGRHSLYIYVAHVIFFAATRIFLRNFFDIHNVPVLLFCGIIAGLIFPVLLFKISQKIGMWWLFSLEKETPSRRPVKLAATSSGQI